MTKSSPVIEVDNVTKSFGSTRALFDVSLTIQPGEVHGLVGRNGAGKSTLVSAISGLVRPDSGTILINGEATWDGGGLSSKSAFAQVALVHQTPALVNSLSVAENLHLEPEFVPDRFGFISWRDLYASAEELLQQWKLNLDPKQLVADLGPAERHMLAIARAMARDASVIILDEPTAALPAAEAELLFDRLRTLALTTPTRTSFPHGASRRSQRTRVLSSPTPPSRSTCVVSLNRPARAC